MEVRIVKTVWGNCTTDTQDTLQGERNMKVYVSVTSVCHALVKRQTHPEIILVEYPAAK